MGGGREEDVRLVSIELKFRNQLDSAGSRHEYLFLDVSHFSPSTIR